METKDNVSFKKNPELMPPSTKPVKGQEAVLIPGDPEHAEEAIRGKTGIPLIQAVVEDLKDIAKQTGIPFPD